RKDGFVSAHHKLTVGADPVPDLMLELERTSTSRFGVWKWVATGAAVVSVGVGVWLFATNGTCSSDTPPGGKCLDLHDNIAPGVVFPLVGAAAAAGAVWMFLGDRPPSTSAPQTGAAILPTSSGVIGVFTTRF